MRTWIAICLIALSGCNTPVPTYTLYRTSVTRDGERMHIATFDADGSEEYNRENCQIAAGLFQAQPGVIVRYWCEKGRFRS